MKDKEIVEILKEYIEECGLVQSLEKFLCEKGLLLEDLKIVGKS